MGHIYPDIEWYIGISQAKACAPRCPFANAHRCPKYYASYSLLGKHGITTTLEPKLDNTIRAKWMKSDIWATLAEEDAAITSANNEVHSFINFCPEVTGQVFGLFASLLSKYADERDRGVVEKWLSDHGRTFAKDWRWEWAWVNPMHYTECPTYSLLMVALNPIVITPKKEEVLSVKPGIFGFTIDLRRLFTRIARWWLSKNV